MKSCCLSKTDVYKELYELKKSFLKNMGFNDDKASRKANIYAVQNTEKYWLLNKQIDKDRISFKGIES